jgi:branched-chain amino acid aminotransferase
VLQLCDEHGIPAFEVDFSLTEVYSADEAFCTGTLAGLMPVREVDGRSLPMKGPGPMTVRLQQLYREAIIRECGGWE